MILGQILQVRVIPYENVCDFVPRPTIVGNWEIQLHGLLLQFHKPSKLQICEKPLAFNFIFFDLLVFGSRRRRVYSQEHLPVK